MRHPCEPVSLHAYGPSGRMRSKPVCKKIGEQSDAQRCKAAESVQRLDGNRGERIVREYLGEASRGKSVRHRQPKQLRNADPRSEERRVGQGCVSTCRSRLSPIPSKKNIKRIAINK